MPRRPHLRDILADPQSVHLPSEPHPLVAARMEWDRQAVETARREKGELLAKDEDTVMGRRRLRIYDALLKAADVRGYGTEYRSWRVTPTSFTIRGQCVEWTLSEQSSPRRVPLSKGELKKPHNIANRITTEEIRVPTGTFKIVASTKFGRKTQITERIDNPFENRAEEILARYEAIADVANDHEADLAAWRRQYEEEKRAGERARRLDAIENARWEHLRELTRDWKEASALRTFIRAVEEELGPDPRAARATAWLQWATERADLLDPLAEGGASVLTEIIRWRYHPRPSEYELSIWELT